MTPEGALKADVVATLNRLGVFYLRLNSGKVRVRRGFMHLCPEGTSDLMILNPECLFVELKAPGQKTQKARAEAQHAFGERVKALGHRHAIIDSVAGLLEVMAKR